MSTHMHTHTRRPAPAAMRDCGLLRGNIYIEIDSHIHRDIHIHIHTTIHKYISLLTYTHIHTHTHTYTHIHTHTQACTRSHHWSGCALLWGT